MNTKHTISILVENHAGVLSRISGLFSRRGFNIDSLAVGETDDPLVSRITIVVQCNDYLIEQVEKQLNKLIDVIRLRRLSETDILSRELVLVKLSQQYIDEAEVAAVMNTCTARIAHSSAAVLILELCDTGERVNLALRKLNKTIILELVRTGVIALSSSEMTLNATE